jgi:hypothetical protein
MSVLALRQDCRGRIIASMMVAYLGVPLFQRRSRVYLPASLGSVRARAT